MSTREALRAAKPKVHSIEVNEQTFHVRALSGAGRAKYLELCREAGDAGPRLAKVVALGLCEVDGTIVYDPDRDQDLTEIEQADGGVLEAIAVKLFEISGLSKDAVESAEKNS